MNVAEQWMPLQLLAAYRDLAIGGDTWLRASDAETFQLIVAAAEACQMVGLLEIIEIREERQTGRRLVEAVRIRRLK
jgi:hypothetical protein